MSKISKNDYYYFLHKTTISSPEKIESLFNEGLKSRYGYSLNSTLYKINEENLKLNGLENEIIGYLGQGDNYNAVVVVKIPKRYFRDIVHRNNKLDPAVPFFREYSEEGYDWTALLTPKLIQGVYCRDINKSFTNPNFNPIFDPSGFQYSDEQVNNFWTYNSLNWVNLDKSRKNSSFEQLYASDKARNTWDKTVNYYSRLYEKKTTSMTKYEMSEDDSILFNNSLVKAAISKK